MLISQTEDNFSIESDFLEILKPFGIDSVIYYLKYILSNSKIEDSSHQNEIINLYKLSWKLDLIRTISYNKNRIW